VGLGLGSNRGRARRLRKQTHARLLRSTRVRRSGISGAFARAAVDSARQRGARALEGYPRITQPGQKVHLGELHVGSRSIFADAGFDEVSRRPSAGS
jgi:hypothetical protein